MSEPTDPFSQEPEDTIEINASFRKIELLPDDCFSRFTNLKSLNLANNYLKILPSSLFKLQFLENLDISNNEFVNIPVEIGLIKTLKTLKIHDNRGAQLSILPTIQDNSEQLISFFRKICSPKSPPPERMFYPPVQLPTDTYFKVVSYNILAPHCSTPDKFPFSPVQYLDSAIRIPRIKEEIVSFDADILCLQEVETGQFRTDFFPYFSNKGYFGIHCPKVQPSNNQDTIMGQAIFVKTSKFAVISTHTIEIRKYPICLTLYNHSDLIRHGEVAVFTLLHSVKYPNYIICVVNVHLYWGRNSHEIRTNQLHIVLTAAKEFLQNNNIYAYDIIIAGDFNATLGTPPIQYMQMTPYDRFYNTYEVLQQVPEFTNLNYLKSLTIDFIFSTPYGIYPISVLPFDTNGIKENYVSFPSQFYPSDHIPVSTIFAFNGQPHYPPPRQIQFPVNHKIQNQPQMPAPSFQIERPPKHAKLIISTKK